MSVMIDSINVNFEEAPDPIEEFINAATMEEQEWTEDDIFNYCTEGETNHTIDQIDNNIWDEMVNKISTEFPKPVNFECPKSVSMDEQMALAIDVITKLVDGEEVIIDGGKFRKPETQSDAYRHTFAEKFKSGEHKELYELWQKGTFSITTCPEGKTPITCRWVYDLKRNDKNEIVRFKARLVVQCFKQREGIDYQKTFSSVAQMRSFRLLVALAVQYDLRITQYDIGNAFVQSDIDTELYMTFPPGYPSKSGNLKEVLKLLKALYGLKQAARLWNKLLVSKFDKAGLQICKTESGVLHAKDEKDGLCLVDLHVDDYLIFTKNEELRKRIEKVMASIFDVKPQGELRLFLGIVVDEVKDNTRTGLKLSQKPYHERLMQSTGFDKEKSSENIGNCSVKLSVHDSPGPGEDKPDWPYMSVGGSTIYSAFATRPDMCYRVVQLTKFNNNPGEAHVKEQKNLLRYIKGTLDIGISFTKPIGEKRERVQIIAFCDSDWAGCPDTRRSTCGFVIMICGGPVSWKSHLKKTLALSSCEAEFMSLNDVAREIIWMCRFLTEVGIPYEIPRIFCDSDSAICWADDPVQHQRNKHVELKYYYIRDIVGKELVRIFRMNTKFNVSDLLTKLSTKQMTKTLRPVLIGDLAPTLEE